MKLLGFALVVIGVLALVYGGMSYGRQRIMMMNGDRFTTTAAERMAHLLAPIAGGVALLGGIVLLVVPGRRRARTRSTRPRDDERPSGQRRWLDGTVHGPPRDNHHGRHERAIAAAGLRLTGAATRVAE
jgi:hypothetical protein